MGQSISYHMTHRWLDSEVKSHLVRWFRLGPFYGERWLDSEVKSHLVRWFRLGPFYGERETTDTTRTLV